MKFLALVTARGGSKGVSRKNVKLLGGKPLIWYTYQSAKESSLFSEIVLSTEDDEIAAIGKMIGFDVPFKRPEYLASDVSKSIDVVNHALDTMDKLGHKYDAVVLLQPTSPFREKGLIKRSVQKFIDSHADSLVSVRKVPHQFNPHWVFEPNDDGYLKIATSDKTLISRRQDLPEAYFRDGQVYISSVNLIKNHNTFLGERLTYVVNSYCGSEVNIDNLSDWDKAENFIEQHNSLSNE
jgi:N-acylneuraminate cytidylyltransferase